MTPFLSRLILAAIATVCVCASVRAGVVDFIAGSGGYTIYTPTAADAPTVRGVIFMYGGSGGDWRYMARDAIWQDAARSLGFAIVGCDANAGNSYLTPSTLQAVLEAAAAATGRPELVNAPIISTGISWGGFISSDWTRNVPTRMIAAVPQRGLDWYDTPLDDPASLQVPLMLILGATDTNAATKPSILVPYYLNWRGATAPDGHASLAIDWNKGHDVTSQSWSMAWAYMAEAIAVRYPAGAVPTATPNTPLVLNALSLESGWLGQRSYVTSLTGADYSSFLNITPYNSYAGNRTDASWLPTEAAARVYQAFTSFDGNKTRTVDVPLQGPLAIVGDAAPLASVVGQTMTPQMASWNAGSTITITVDPREFDDVRSITRMEYYDGSTPLGFQTTPGAGGVWSMPVTLTRGIHGLTVIATNSVGARTSAFRTVVAAPARTTSYTSGFESSAYAGNGTRLTFRDPTSDNAWTTAASTNGTLGPTSDAYSSQANPAGGTGNHIRFTDSSATQGLVTYLNTGASTAATGNQSLRIAFKYAVTVSSGTGNGLTFGSSVGYGISNDWVAVQAGRDSGGTTYPYRAIYLSYDTAPGVGLTQVNAYKADGTYYNFVPGAYVNIACQINPLTFQYQSVKVDGVEQLGMVVASGLRAGMPATAYAPMNSATTAPLSYFHMWSSSAGTGTYDVDDVVMALTTPWQQWLQSNNLPTDGSGTGSPTATPAGDGVANLIKYALGQPAGTINQSALPSSNVVSDYLTLSYTRPEPAPAGITYIVEASGDLQTWSAIGTVATPGPVLNGALTIAVRDSLTVSAQSKRFLRLRITMP